MFGVNPVDAAEILDLLNLKAYEYDNPQVYGKVEAVLKYFKDNPNRRQKALTILSGKHGDKLDILWEYSELNRLKKEKLKQLNPDDFEPDIAKELSGEYLTKQNITRVKEDIEKRKTGRQQQAQEARDEKEAEKLSKKLDKISSDIAEIEELNEQIDKYE